MEGVTPEKVGFSSARLRRIDDTMRRLVDSRKIAGAVTLVARRGQIAHSEAFGQMDVETGQPMERDTIFRIASMTKPITTTAVMMLFEEGHFLLDDPIADFLPEFAQTKVFVRETESGVEVADLQRPITIRHLLTHTSGLTYDFMPSGPVNRMYSQEQIMRPDEALGLKVKRIAGLPLVFQPGSYWEYSVSLDVLGRLVELVSGQPFDVFLSDRVFAPLEMIDTGFYVPPQRLSRLASVHAPDGHGGLQRDEHERDRSKPPAFLGGGGGLVSTAADYARFCQMLLNGGALSGTQLLGRKTVELLLADHLPDGLYPLPPDRLDPGTSQALGGATFVNVARSGLPSSAGTYTWVGAYSTGFWIDRREELCGLFLCQLSPFDFRSFNLFQVLAYQGLVE